MIKIVMDDGERLFWDADEYTDYECNYGLFIVKNGDRWVGIYNMDHLLFVEVDERSESFEGFNTAEPKDFVTTDPTIAKDLGEAARILGEKLREEMELVKKTLDWKKENGK